MKVKVKLEHENAKVPTRATEHSNGYDIYAAEPARIAPGQRVAVATGVKLEIPEGYVGMACPRSGRAIKDGLTLINPPGIIDSDYRGEVKALLINHSQAPIYIQIGERVMQMVFVKTEEIDFEEVTELSDTQRGTGGLGHTGK